VESLLSLIAGAALKATGILVFAFLITAAWRTASASARHLVWATAVTAALLLPIAAIGLTRLGSPRVEVPFNVPVATVTANIASPADDDREDIAVLPASVPGPAVEVIESPVTAEIELPALAAIVASSTMDGLFANWESAAILLWALGACLALLPLLVATLRVAAISRNARPVTDGRWKYLIESTPAVSHLSSRVRILESDGAAMPMTWGCVRPTLLIPSGTAAWPDWKCRNILLHELAHIERRDCLTQLVAQVACAVYWFNPLAWIAAHRMRVERELACDDRVIAAGAAASDYAANLLEVARSLRAPSFTSRTAIAMARPSQLSGRLLAVLDTHRNRAGVSRPVLAAASIFASILVVVLASLTTRAAVATAAETPVGRITTVAADGARSLPTEPASFAPAPFAIVKATQIPNAAPEPAVAVARQSQQSCWDRGEKSNVSISSNSDKSRETWHVRYTSDDCSLEMRAEGKFRLRGDLTDLESIARDGWFRLEEREGRSSRRVEIRAG
jgi:beta-lactamase regulating signal transducer with metallopeptidase domain